MGFLEGAKLGQCLLYCGLLFEWVKFHIHICTPVYTLIIFFSILTPFSHISSRLVSRNSSLPTQLTQFPKLVNILKRYALHYLRNVVSEKQTSDSCKTGEPNRKGKVLVSTAAHYCWRILQNKIWSTKKLFGYNYVIKIEMKCCNVEI